MNRDWLLQVRSLEVKAFATLVKAFREHTPLSVSDIAHGLKSALPLTVARLHGPDRDAVLSRALALLQTLKSVGTEFEIILDGRVETPETFGNLLNTWEQTAADTEMEVELELGEPGVATLERLKQGDQGVFFDVLRQIKLGEGFDVDAETLSWVERELAADRPTLRAADSAT